MARLQLKEIINTENIWHFSNRKTGHTICSKRNSSSFKLHNNQIYSLQNRKPDINVTTANAEESINWIEIFFWMDMKEWLLNGPNQTINRDGWIILPGYIFGTEYQIIFWSQAIWERSGSFSTHHISLVVSSWLNFLIKNRESRFCFGLFDRIDAWLLNLKTSYPSPLFGQSDNKITFI